jgi:hypothetical protein
MANPTILVPAPHREPRRGGIKSVTGDFIPLERLGAAANIHYVSDGCVWPSLAPGLCWGADPGGDKSFGGMDIEDGIGGIFAQYVGVECFLGAGNDVEFTDRARRQLEYGEAHEIEAGFVAWAAGGAAAGTGAGIANAIAAAEEYADQHYIGAPVLLMSRHSAVLGDAANALDGDGIGGIWTINGSPVVATWLMPDDKIYVIGWPSVYASQIATAASHEIVQNREQALAERIYAMAVDCTFRAVVTITAPVGAGTQQNPPAEEDRLLTIGTVPGSPVAAGTDLSVHVHSNFAPAGEVNLSVADAATGPWTDLGEMTEVTDFEFISNFQTDGLAGTKFLKASADSTASPVIAVDIT